MNRARLLTCCALLGVLLAPLPWGTPALAQSGAVEINLDVLDQTAVVRNAASSLPAQPQQPAAAPASSGNIPLKWIQTGKKNETTKAAPARPIEKPASPVAATPLAPSVKPPAAPLSLPAEKPAVPRPARPLMTVPAPVLKPSRPVIPPPTGTAITGQEIPLPKRPPPPNSGYPPPMALPSKENAVPPLGTLPPIPVPPEASLTAPEDKNPEHSPRAVPSLSDLSLGFEGGSNDLAADTQGKLDEIVRQMVDNQTLRLQLRAFAAAENKDSSSARRLSLARALAVRSYLMDHGISPSRVDVRALGDKTDQAPHDRVDVVFVR